MLELMLSPAVLAVLGLAVGSFLNVVAHRLPMVMERQWWSEAAGLLGDAELGQRVLAAAAHEAHALHEHAQSSLQRLQGLPHIGLARPASRCPACGHRIRWHENLPVLSWVWLRGRCSACGTAISWRYPAVEAFTALLFAGVALRFGPQPEALAWCGFAAALVALSLIDWDTTLLPDSITQPLLWAGLLGAGLGLTGTALQSSLAGAVAGFLSLFFVHHLFLWITKKQGMGQGDFKLLAALGAWLGWQALLPVVLMASLIGAVVGFGMKRVGTLREGLYVPFGPFLAGAGLVVMLAGLPRVLGLLGW